MTELVCEICNQKYDNYRSFSLHIKNKHKIEPKDYYDMYLKKDGEGICKVCGKKTNWINMNKGYAKFCSNLCISKSKEIQKRREDTNLKRYGERNASYVDEFKEKRRLTKLERYGYEYGFEDESFKTNAEQIMLKKYGTTNVNKLPNIQEKITNTNLKKYGYKSPIQNEEIKNKIIETNLKKYGYEWGILRPEVVKKARIQFQKKKSDIIYKLKKLNLSNGYKSLNSKLNNLGLKLLCDENEYKGTYDIHTMKRYYYYLECMNCGHIFYSAIAFGELPKCPKCSSTYNISNPEFEIYNYIINELNIPKDKIIQSDRSGIAGKSIDNKFPKELDIYLPEYKFAIEFNGLYWHSELFLDKNYHLNKTIVCESNGIQLFHIFENEWLNPIKQDIWKSIISSKLNKNKRIYARDTIVKEISPEDSISFLNENHLQGGLGAKYYIGLFYKDELISVATFGEPRYNKNYEYELLRFANKKYTNVIGGFSKLLKYFERKYSPKSLITYADRRLSNGNLYEKTGFEFLRNTDPNYWYIHDNSLELYSRYNFQKHKLKNLLENYDPNLSEHENMLNNGFLRVYDCGHKVYLKYF